jgi:hypothetical protein
LRNSRVGSKAAQIKPGSKVGLPAQIRCLLLARQPDWPDGLSAYVPVGCFSPVRFRAALQRSGRSAVPAYDPSRTLASAPGMTGSGGKTERPLSGGEQGWRPSPKISRWEWPQVVPKGGNPMAELRVLTRGPVGTISWQLIAVMQSTGR